MACGAVLRRTRVARAQRVENTMARNLYQVGATRMVVTRSSKEAVWDKQEMVVG
jgi:hypothetical protein